MRCSIRDVSLGKGAGVVAVQNCGRALMKPKNQPGGVTLGSLMAEMKHNLQCRHLGCQKKL